MDRPDTDARLAMADENFENNSVRRWRDGVRNRTTITNDPQRNGKLDFITMKTAINAKVTWDDTYAALPTVWHFRE